MQLRLATKALNDAMGENGLVPSLLVFGLIPRFPIIATDMPTQSERMVVLATARAEMEQSVAARLIEQALRHHVPNAADRVCSTGKEVLVCRELIDEWKGL